MQTKLSHIYIYTRLYSSHNNYTTDDDNYNYNNKSKAVKIIKYDTGQNMEQQQQQKRKKKLKKLAIRNAGWYFMSAYTLM